MARTLLAPAATAPADSELCAYLRLAAVITSTLLIDLANSYAAVAVVGHVFADEPAVLVRQLSCIHNIIVETSFAAYQAVNTMQWNFPQAGVSVGNMLFNICLLSTSYGMASGLDTLLSQAHGAFASLPIATQAVRPHPGRAYVRWTCMLLVVGWLPLAAPCIWSGPVLHFLGQPHEVAERAGSFARVLTFASGPALVTRTIQCKILNCCGGITWPSLVGSLCGSLANMLVLLACFHGGGSESGSSSAFQWIAPKLGMSPASSNRFLGAALAKGAYAVTAASVTGSYMIATRNPICPFGCCCGCHPARSRRLRVRVQLIGHL